MTNNFDKTIADTCAARFHCKQHEKACSTICPLWIDLKYQTELSGIPKRFQKYQTDNLPEDTYALPVIQKFGDSITERVPKGEGLYLYGSTGLGKTTIACAIAMTYISHQSLLDIRTGKRTKQLVSYANVPDLLDLIKKGFDDTDIQLEANAKLEALRTAPLAILDDIGAEKPSEWARERLLTIINDRYDNELATIVTSNLSIPELVEPLGARIRSRIEGLTFPLQFKGTDRRRKL
jgi:DNA replication protein DnaC